MNIGEKIRELRVAKLMTQAELAGTRITRNMLSCIENGTANPSLSTVLYIAGRLNVPVGFLLAEEGDEVVYRKMNSFANIKRAYTAGDYWGCRSLCVSGFTEADDEISLLLANCDSEIAIMEFWQGKLRSSCRFFDEALTYAEKTMYDTGRIFAQAGVYFRYMYRISPTIYMDFWDDEKQGDVKINSPFSHYLEALEALDEGDESVAVRFLENSLEDSFFDAHLKIRLMMQEGSFGEAKKALSKLLNAENPLNEIYLYTVLCELEICCRETEDFKGAYNYANDKMQLLEHMLSEI